MARRGRGQAGLGEKLRERRRFQSRATPEAERQGRDRPWEVLLEGHRVQGLLREMRSVRGQRQEAHPVRGLLRETHQGQDPRQEAHPVRGLRQGRSPPSEGHLGQARAPLPREPVPVRELHLLWE